MPVFQNKNLFKAFLEKKIKEQKVEESLGLGKKRYGTETDTKNWSWFQLLIWKSHIPINLISFFGSKVTRMDKN